MASTRRRSGGRPNFRDDAFVLRTHKLGEADLILVLLTQKHGIVRGVARGIRKTKSRFGARLDLFTRANIQFYPSSSLGNVTDAATVASYAAPIVRDPDAFFAASAALEIAGIIGAETVTAEGVFDFLDQVLARLAGDSSLPPKAWADWFVLHALAIAGWPPQLVDCAQCGRPGPHRAFHPLVGGAVCVNCRPPGASTPDPQVLRFLWLLSHDRFPAAAQVVAEQGHHVATAAHGLLVGHVRSHVEVGCPAFAAL